MLEKIETLTVSTACPSQVWMEMSRMGSDITDTLYPWTNGDFYQPSH
jgi:hypothetical protein